MTVQDYVRSLKMEGAPSGSPLGDSRFPAPSPLVPARSPTESEAGANAITAGLAQVLASRHPSYAQYGLGLTPLEARIDRGVGMLLRPPSRLFSDAGLDRAMARSMPIRLDLEGGMMGGAFIPARLIPGLEELIERRTARFLKRLAEAEMDNVAALGLLIEACRYAREAEMGLYEAINVIDPDEPRSWPPGATVITANRKRLDPHLRKRLEEAAKPPKRPNAFSRWLKRGATGPGENGRVKEADEIGRSWEDRAQ